MLDGLLQDHSLDIKLYWPQILHYFCKKSLTNNVGNVHTLFRSLQEGENIIINDLV